MTETSVARGRRAVASSAIRAQSVPGVRLQPNCCFGTGVLPPAGHHWVKPFRRKHVHLAPADGSETVCGIPVDGSSRWNLAPTYLVVCRLCAERFDQTRIL